MNNDSSNKNFSVIPGLNMGLFSPKDLAVILKVINKYDVPATKITGAQRLALLGMEQEDMKAMHKELKPFIRETVPNGVTYVQACPGEKWCRYGMADSVSLGKKLEALSFEEPFTAKVKVAVSACRMCCTEPYLRDVGIYASKSGWTLVFGGNGGGRPRIADVIAKKLSEDEVVEFARKCLTLYQKEARPATRSARFMERQKIDEFKKLVLE
jgi:NAD(P)H-nitrite reductase large subunit